MLYIQMRMPMFLHHPRQMLLVGPDTKFGIFVQTMPRLHGEPLTPTSVSAMILDGMRLVQVEVLLDILGQDTKYMREKRVAPR